MLKEIIKLGNRLDELGLHQEADLIDQMIQKLAEYQEAEETYEEPEYNDGSPSGVVQGVYMLNMDGYSLLGAYSTRGLAEAEIEKAGNRDDLTILELELDQPLEIYQLTHL